jgi:cytochrome c peroxidase
MKGQRRLWMVSAVALLACGLWFARGTLADEPGVIEFSAAEVQRILSHGPWPMPWKPDPSNRVSGTHNAIDLGERLFFDEKLSVKGNVSCGTCHIAEYNWTDGLRRNKGQAEVDRNTPTLMNARHQRWFALDGAADSLWSQSMRPIVDARELASTPAHVATYIRKDKDLACRYEKTFGVSPSAQDDEAVLVGVGKVMAAFQETLNTDLTPFDAFRDALARGDKAAASLYPREARRGLQIFVGKGNCSVCHSGPMFSDGEFYDIGVTRLIGGDAKRVDNGRDGGVAKLRASKFNLLGPYNDDASRAAGERIQQLKQAPGNGGFKTPSLRNVGYTAPYMHNGEMVSLEEVVRHYAGLTPERIPAHSSGLLRPLKLTPQESADLVAFLQTLNMDRAPPWRGKEYAEPPCVPGGKGEAESYYAP